MSIDASVRDHSMSYRQQAQVEALIRRRDLLAERLTSYRRDGNRSRTAAELGALNFAIQIIRAAAQEGVLTDLERVPVTSSPRVEGQR